MIWRRNRKLGYNISILALMMNKTYVIDSHAGLQLWARLRECWQRRDLIQVLGARDIKVRYTQTALGMLWAIINPLISVLLLFFVFNIILKIDTGIIPPFLFTMSGMCAWNYFSKVVSEAGTSIIGAQELVRKIYFPRLVIPISKSLSAIVEFIIVLVFLFTLLIIYKTPLDIRILLIIPFTFMLVIIATGYGIWIAALTIRFRDFHYIVPVLLRIGMFVSPIAFGSTHVPPGYKWVLSLNPLTGIIDGFRYALFGTLPDWPLLIFSLLVSVVICIVGVVYFLRMEQYIADIV